MRLKPLFTACCVAACLHAFAGDRVVIEPVSGQAGKAAKGVRMSERVVLTGRLQTVPMGGAMLTLQSTNYGQVILFRPFDVDAQAEKRLSAMEASRTSVKVTATLNTMCSKQQLRADVMWCRTLDVNKPITIESY
jgi:hypothetical protein